MKTTTMVLKKTVFIFFVCVSGFLNAQTEGVAIKSNSAAPNSSAMLDVESGNKGVLIPRMALKATNNSSPVNKPATSLLVYNTATAGAKPYHVTPGYYYWDGLQWRKIVMQDKGTSGGGVVPIKGIIMWKGAVVDIPVGWQLCDGRPIDFKKNPKSPLGTSYHTPDLGGMFIVGYNPSVADYNNVGNVGGYYETTLTVANIPSHTHTGTASGKVFIKGSTQLAGNHTHTFPFYNTSYENNDGAKDRTDVIRLGSNAQTSSAGTHPHEIKGTFSITGSPTMTLTPNGEEKPVPIDNRPSFYILAYIIRVQ